MKEVARHDDTAASSMSPKSFISSCTDGCARRSGESERSLTRKRDGQKESEAFDARYNHASSLAENARATR